MRNIMSKRVHRGTPHGLRIVGQTVRVVNIESAKSEIYAAEYGFKVKDYDVNH